jgi:hypothetical protein
VHRVLAKYGHGDASENIRQAEVAFQKALEINPDLPLAHNLYTYFEVEERGAAPQAMLRLLTRVEAHAGDPNLFAGLVVACRFCGLLGASLAADRRARRIDPTIRTSVGYTHWMLADWAQAARTDEESIQVLRHGASWMLGRQAEALAGLSDLAKQLPAKGESLFVQMLHAAFVQDRAACVDACRQLLELGFHDPEGLLLLVRCLAHVGEPAFALELLSRSVHGGCYCPTALLRDPWLDPLRAEPEFLRCLRYAEQHHAEAVQMYIKAGGERILGALA